MLYLELLYVYTLTSVHDFYVNLSHMNHFIVTAKLSIVAGNCCGHKLYYWNVECAKFTRLIFVLVYDTVRLRQDTHCTSHSGKLCAQNMVANNDWPVGSHTPVADNHWQWLSSRTVSYDLRLRHAQKCILNVHNQMSESDHSKTLLLMWEYRFVKFRKHDVCVLVVFWLGLKHHMLLGFHVLHNSTFDAQRSRTSQNTTCFL